jgi:hypothetical protein
MKPGDSVRYRGAVCKIVELASLPTPTGGQIKMVLIARPRGGDKWVLPHELHAVPREQREQVDPERFR